MENLLLIGIGILIGLGILYEVLSEDEIDEEEINKPDTELYDQSNDVLLNQ